jgi:putative intracellular protease/amidase
VLTGPQFYQSGKIVSAVCHGLAALVGVTDVQGKSIFAGKNVTGFSNVEEEILGTTKVGMTQSHHPAFLTDVRLA